MELVPSRFFITHSSAVSRTSDLNAFDRALISAGIGEQNLVSVSPSYPRTPNASRSARCPWGPSPTASWPR